MCTVTLVRDSDGARLVCNRDERRTRGEALAPEVRSAGARRALWPMDPDAGGTWVGVNDAGVVACLLNANAGGRSTGVRSRGEVVPELLRAGSLAEAMDAADSVGTGGFSPFRLLLAEGSRTVVRDAAGVWEEQGLGPVMLTSSSLGDHVVEGPRRALFASMFGAGGARGELRAVQSAFHAHAWEGRERVSVRMRREEARTVSRTVVELGAGRARMRYAPLDELGCEGGAVERELAVRACEAGVMA